MKDGDDENKQGTPIWGVPGSTWHIVVCVESHKLLGNTYPINKPHPNFSVTASAYHNVNLRVSSVAYKIRHGHGIVERRSPTPYPTPEYPQPPTSHMADKPWHPLPERLPTIWNDGRVNFLGRHRSGSSPRPKYSHSYWIIDAQLVWRWRRRSSGWAERGQGGRR
ncbi:hypothetical protein B0H65DRAFT_151628 [Neurospora tetraspora]|uniref:Uncharacterized protein n=1 Tax=Neurospora tetraspora TaxID=94610 RepID=A0AAE0JI03_9PEZI|nr:hypothetical protein B0H65DRAFT_151628 [Neurospora tetraspora]